MLENRRHPGNLPRRRGNALPLCKHLLGWRGGILTQRKQIEVQQEQCHHGQEPWTCQEPDTMTTSAGDVGAKKIEFLQLGPRKSLNEPSGGEDTLFASFGPISV